MDQTSRTYWRYQAGGWMAFTMYVLTAYVASVGLHHVRAFDVANIIFVNAMLCPAVSDGLRRYMRACGWLTLPWRRLFPRLAIAVLTIAIGITGFVALTAAFPGGVLLPPQAMFGMFAAFALAMTAWLVIYFQVLARRRQRALERHALELSVVARDAQIRALRSQINPHFLFNSLNSVRGLIGEDPQRARAMVTGFSSLMRYALGSDRRELVTLGEELAAVDDYLALERMRFDERLRVEQVISPEAAGITIPPMMVQALVENAVKHGISNLRDGGVLRIDARVSGGLLEVRVTNTGTIATRSAETGVGLANARERLRLIYGDAASLSLEPSGPDTVVATLVVPQSVPQP